MPGASQGPLRYRRGVHAEALDREAKNRAVYRGSPRSPRGTARHSGPEVGEGGARGNPGYRSSSDSAGAGEVGRDQPVLAGHETARLGRWPEHGCRAAVRRITRSASQRRSRTRRPHDDLIPKRLELLRALTPNLARVALL